MDRKEEGLKTKDFSFDLPGDLIAQHPSPDRGESKMLVYDRKNGEIQHLHVTDLADIVPSGSAMVFNDSKVRKARIIAEGEGGGQFEILVIKKSPDFENTWQCVVKKSARLKRGKRLRLPDGSYCTIADDAFDSAGVRLVRFDGALDESWFERFGHIPLPPYIRRGDEHSDSDRYQTIYAKHSGSAAAPTAGLHFTPAIFEAIDKKRILRTQVTLHVGLGTFMPVRSEEIENHKMHKEDYVVPDDTGTKINACVDAGRLVVAVGTTSLRTLESASDETGHIRAGEGSTSIFIYPGYSFKIVKALFTNFHTPESTLLMLVSAFAGYEEIMRVYKIAVERKYRFFSYGDAMLIL